MQFSNALKVLDVDASLAPKAQLKHARAMFILLSMSRHPDKGGTAEQFVELKDAWDLVHATLVKEHSLARDDVDIENAMATIAAMVPNKEPVALYRLERAKKARGKPDRRIEPNELCFGYLDPHLGDVYTGWEPVDDQLRIPARLHRLLTALDLVDGVRAGHDETEICKAVLRNSANVVSGINELSPEHFEQFLKVFMNRNTWCHMNPAFMAKLAAEDAAVEVVAQDAPVVNAAAIVPLAPIDTADFKPGALKGYVFVTTGRFPLPGTSPGLNQGKNEIKAIIVNGGGTNPGNVSGKTTHLLVGTDPGNKVDQADARGIKKIDLLGLTELLRGVPNKDVKAITTKHMKRSAGYPTNPALTQEGPQLKLQRLA